MTKQHNGWTARRGGAWTAIALAAGAAAWMAGAVPARASAPEVETAQGQTRQETVAFDVPAQPLAAALKEFARQSGWQFSYPAGLTEGLSSAALQGAMTPAEALARLLAGTPVTWKATGARSFALTRPETGDRLTLGTVSVEGRTEHARGPVQGYVATRSATGTKTDTPIVETPQSISVITRDEMATTKVTSITEAIGYTPGVVGQAAGFSRMVDDLMVRGFNVANGNLGMLRDGLKLQSNVYDGGQEPFGLERVEILRGPSSILYGQLGPGGAVNAVSKRPTETPFAEANAEFGSYDRRQLTADVGGAVDARKTLSLRLTGLYREADNWVDHVNDDKRYLAPSLTWKATDDTTLTVLTSLQQVRTKFAAPMDYSDTINSKVPTDLFIGEPDFDRYDADAVTAGYELEHAFADRLKMRHSLRRFHSRVDWHYLTYNTLQANNSLTRGVSYRAEKSDALATDTSLEANFSSGPVEHTLLFGTDLYLRTYDRDRYSGSVSALNDIFNPTYGATPTINRNTNTGFKSSSDHLGFYIQDQAKIFEKLILLGGLRVDWVKSETTTLSTNAVTKERDRAATGRAGLVYLFDNGVSPYASFSQSFTPQTGTDRLGSPFEPTEGEQYEMGVRYQPPGTNLMVGAAVYQLTQSNVLTTDPVDTSFSIQTGEVRSRGLELEAKASLGNLNLLASYSYTDARITATNTASEQGQRVTLVPYNVLGLWADYGLETLGVPGLRIGAGLQYQGSSNISSFSGGDSPAVTRVDAMLSYDFGALDRTLDGAAFVLNAKNVLDEESVVCVAGDGGCRYGAPLTVTATLKYRW